MLKRTSGQAFAGAALIKENDAVFFGVENSFGFVLDATSGTTVKIKEGDFGRFIAPIHNVDFVTIANI